MKAYTISEAAAGQPLLKFAAKVLPAAPMGLIHKSLRKKNIDVNRRKCTGKEVLAAGDVVHIWFSTETLEKFSGGRPAQEAEGDAELARWILYEDEEVLLVNKPAGLLTQSDREGTRSLNDRLLRYTGIHDGVKPSVCNRLDRNTSGLVLCGKTVRALQALSAVLKDRSVHKYYRALLWGRLAPEGCLTGFLVKSEAENAVRILQQAEAGAWPVETRYRRLRTWEDGGVVLSEAEIWLVTGRPHQIRAHMASIGHPLLGDRKYGSRESIAFSEAHGIRRQRLHAERVVFPVMEGVLSRLSGKEITAPLPGDFYEGAEP